jgi:intracellular septation protein
MSQLFDFFPIILFFIAFKLYDIFVATGVMIAATLIQVGFNWFRHRKVETMQLVTLGLVVVFGGATILLHDEQFVKWKLSIVEWLMGLGFIGSQFIGEKPFVERMMSKSLTLPDPVWRRLNLMWGLFFISVGFINVYVMFQFNTEQWVNFKTFGVPGLLLVFIALQMAYLYKHIPDSKD